MGRPLLYILAKDPALRRVLAAQLAAGDNFTVTTAVPDRAANGQAPIVVAAASDCPPSDCRRLTSLGLRVVVLASIPRAGERAAYLGAGAVAYLPMTVGPGGVSEDIKRALDEAPPLAAPRRGPLPNGSAADGGTR
jgi:hypothetical protein